MENESAKNLRREKILRIINTREIKTQKQLSDELEKEGFKTTQATLSRDIRRLALSKRTSGRGEPIYAQTPREKPVSILNGTVLSADLSGCVAVVKTRSGMAMAVAAAIDESFENKLILGTIAGDDTIFAVLPEKHAKSAFSRLKAWLWNF